MYSGTSLPFGQNALSPVQPLIYLLLKFGPGLPQPVISKLLIVEQFLLRILAKSVRSKYVQLVKATVSSLSSNPLFKREMINSPISAWSVSVIFSSHGRHSDTK
jgi:hypothetical protein